MRSTNSATFPPQKSEVFPGFEPGGAIGQVASFGESDAGESAFRLSFRLRIRQSALENGGKPAPHGTGPPGGESLLPREVAQERGPTPTILW